MLHRPNTTRQERKSCETCRARKLRCSGEKTGCSRCRSLSLTCRFKDKGAPGRPRKKAVVRDHVDYSPASSLPGSLPLPQMGTLPVPVPVPVPGLSPSPLVLGEFDRLQPSELSLSVDCGFDALPRGMGMLLGEGGGDICSFPIESWLPDEGNMLATPVSDPFASPLAIDQVQRCKCDEEVSGIIRSLSRLSQSLSVDIIRILREGVALAERLLTCAVCYDVSKPPRVTVQNVLLIGHLMFEVTGGYQKYLAWLKQTGSDRGEEGEGEGEGRKTVYIDAGSGMGRVDLQVSSEKVRELVMHGLEMDVERLLELGGRFAQRQRNRHLVGHETCPDAEGRCRQRQDGVDRDPLDLCPHHPVARGLVPCFRIVDEVRQMVQQVATLLNT